MHQIWTNPSMQRNVHLVRGNKYELMKCGKITKTGIDNNTRSIVVIPGLEYAFEYISPDTADSVSIECIVLDLYNDCVKVKRINDVSNKHDRTRHENKCTVCAMLDSRKNVDDNTLFIPTANILDVKCVYTNRHKEEVRVMILGISAEIVKAIIINMNIFDDRYESAVKKVTLECGKMYDIMYKRNGTVYNCIGRAISIEEDDRSHPAENECCHVREHVNHHNHSYIEFDDVSKAEFMEAKPVKRVKITLDVSETFCGDYETILLGDIIDCTAID